MRSNTITRTGRGTLAALAACLLALPAAALTPAQKCEADKLKTAGKYTFCRLKEDAKAVKKGVPADYAKCDAKYGAKWTSVEDKAGGACPVTGDQAAIQTQAGTATDDLAAAIAGTPSGPRFVDNGDGTITDNVSGLMWEKKVQLGGGANPANLHDADNTYGWSGTCTVATGKRCQPTVSSATLCAAHVEGNPDGCAVCTGGEGTCSVASPGGTLWQWLADLNTASFAGHTDWRVPTRQDLQTILDYTDTTSPLVNAAFQGASCGVACADITSAACSCTRSSNYWSASTYAPVPTRAWVINFDDGSMPAEGKPSTNFPVRAVRGGS